MKDFTWTNSVSFGDYSVKIDENWVSAFKDTEKRMEENKKKKELQEKQQRNKRLRGMVKKVIFSSNCTIIMWNDGTKTITKCHELDVYDKEKGILACMAKKLYENTNIFNEVIQEYVDFKKEVPRTVIDSYIVDIESLEMLDILQEYKHYINCLEADLNREHLNYEEMENIYYSLQTQFDACVKRSEEYIKDIDALTERIKDMEERLVCQDRLIDSLQTENYWLEEERNELQEELDNCK